MELRYENLKGKPKAFRSFTGFDVEEFQILLGPFTTVWESYSQQNRLPAELRQRGYGGGRKARLGTCENKLLFILVYFKTYPLQEVLAFHFDMSQGQACQWIGVLSEVLRLALGELGHLPPNTVHIGNQRLILVSPIVLNDLRIGLAAQLDLVSLAEQHKLGLPRHRIGCARGQRQNKAKDKKSNHASL